MSNLLRARAGEVGAGSREQRECCLIIDSISGLICGPIICCSCYLPARITELSNLPQRQLDATDCWLSDASSESFPCLPVCPPFGFVKMQMQIELEHLLTAGAAQWAGQELCLSLFRSPALTLVTFHNFPGQLSRKLPGPKQTDLGPS